MSLRFRIVQVINRIAIWNTSIILFLFSYYLNVTLGTVLGMSFLWHSSKIYVPFSAVTLHIMVWIAEIIWREQTEIIWRDDLESCIRTVYRKGDSLSRIYVLTHQILRTVFVHRKIITRDFLLIARHLLSIRLLTLVLTDTYIRACIFCET